MAAISIPTPAGYISNTNNTPHVDTLSSQADHRRWHSESHQPLTEQRAAVAERQPQQHGVSSAVADLAASLELRRRQSSA
jgi:hypothetical protein